MKVVHKNSREEYHLIAPNYIKLNSIYGYLVGGSREVFFIYNIDDELYYDIVSEDFEILSF